MVPIKKCVAIIIILTICWLETGTLKCSAGSDTIDYLYADYTRFDLTTNML